MLVRWPSRCARALARTSAWGGITHETLPVSTTRQKGKEENLTLNFFFDHLAKTLSSSLWNSWFWVGRPGSCCLEMGRRKGRRCTGSDCEPSYCLRKLAWTAAEPVAVLVVGVYCVCTVMTEGSPVTCKVSHCSWNHFLRALLQIRFLITRLEGSIVEFSNLLVGNVSGL